MTSPVREGAPFAVGGVLADLHGVSAPLSREGHFSDVLTE